MLPRISGKTLPAVALLLVLQFPAALTSRSDSPRHVTFEERVRAQEAIERVYYSHQIDAKLPFQEAIPAELLRKKVTTYLKQSAALENRWRTPITAEALQRELGRIARSTRFPDRLRELFRALGDDPV